MPKFAKIFDRSWTALLEFTTVANPLAVYVPDDDILRELGRLQVLHS